jgi:hypothetical protein
MSGTTGSPIVSDHENDTLVYTRLDGMPDPATWVREIEILEEFEARGDTPADLAWDGTGLWFAGGFFSQSIRRRNPPIGLVVDSTLAVGHAGHAVDFDGMDRWLYAINLRGSVTARIFRARLP